MFAMGPAFFNASSGGSSSELAPASLHFTLAATISTFLRQPTGVALDFSNNFANTTDFTVLSSNGTTTTTGTELTLTTSNGLNAWTQGPAWAIPQGFTSVDVSLKSTNTTSNFLRVGIASGSANNRICALMNMNNGYISIEVVNAGTSYYSAGSNTISLSGLTVFKFGFALVGNSAQSYIDTGSGWQLLETYSVYPHFDLSVVSVFSGFKSFFGIFSTGSVTWKFTNYKSGLCGCDKLRDPGLVINPDGTPYITGGEAYFCTSITPIGLQTHMGVFAINLTTYAVRQVSALLFNRSGVFEFDLAGTIVRNSSTSYDVWCATWGNGFGTGGTIQIQWANVAADLLAGGRFSVGSLTKPTLPGLINGDSGCYDPTIWFDGTTYTLAYTLVDTTTFAGSPYYPALATSPDRVTWTLVGSDSTRKGFEGSRLVKTNTNTWLLAGGPSTMEIYNSSMAYVGLLDGAVSGGGVTQPWPTVFANGSSFVMLSFDGTENSAGTNFSWGNLIVKTAPRY